MNKSFSLLEILFVIALIGILLVVAIPKMETLFTNTTLNKIKNEILLIREGITLKKNQLILAKSTQKLHTLEENEIELFYKILQNPIIASEEKKIGSWSKLSSDTYRVYLSNQNSVDFIYDNDDYSFECDFNNQLCKELTQ